MDLIHPHSKHDVVLAMREASDRRQRVLVVGGRTHMDRGNPCEVDAELWTTMLDEVVAYEQAEMLAVVEAGMRVGELQGLLAEHQQEWPVDAPANATVGGVIAAGVSSPRRARVGHVRDTVLELELVTGDGRLVRSGARTVKNVTGYDIHRLATGSLGTLGVIVQVALKLRPRPQASSSLLADGDGLELGARLLERVPLAAGVAAARDAVQVRLEGWDDEVEQLADLARRAVPDLRTVAGDDRFPSMGALGSAPVVAEAAVPPSRVAQLVAGLHSWIALLGVGIVWCGLRDDGEPLAEIRARAASLGGIAPVIAGPGGLGDAGPPALDVHRRLKGAFDPAGILAPGRFWGGL